ncbi:hypothetical protein P7C70_g6635, partial [Phenoliferia sp. Uapishka_3]
MILRPATPAFALRHLPLASPVLSHPRRLVSTSAATSALSRKNAAFGSRLTRVTRQRPRAKPGLKELEEVAPDAPTTAADAAHLSPLTPPWPMTSSPGGKAFPYKGYNEGPPPPEVEKTPAAGPLEVEASSEERPPLASVPVEVPYDALGVLDNATGEWSDRTRRLFSVSAILLSPSGELLGYLMEEDLGFRAAITRQALRTHRAFKATVLDVEGNVLLRIRRPFSWINSRIYISTPSTTELESDEKIIGEAQQEWHVWRRKYSQFVKRDGEFEQFGQVDSGFLAWDFYVRDQNGATIGSINRNFAGLGRELFTDTGQYVLRFEGVVDELLDPRIASPPVPDALPSPTSSSSTSAASSAPSDTNTTPSVMRDKNTTEDAGEISSVPSTIPLPSITFDQRAVMLASAVSIDFDYFTRSRGGIGSSMMWMPMPMGGTGTTDAGVAGAGAAGAAGGMMGEDPLPSAGSEGEGYDGGMSGGEGGSGSSGGGGEESYGSGGWSDAPIEDPSEVMVDPWAQSPSSGEDGGTWSWGDLFPDD